jgi:dihydropteroate synthase
MGVVNVTPDSFSDGGRFLEEEPAIAQAVRLADEGAAVVDIGGESTRPGSDEIPVADELARVLPVIRGLRAARPDVAISIDTSKAEVAAAALDAGATIVNDVTALGDPAMAPLVAERGCDLILMHMLGNPRTMQLDPRYDDVVAEVGGYLAARVEQAVAAGVARGRIAIDPGIGFGKTLDHNLELIRATAELEGAIGCPVLVGASRKSMLGRLLGDMQRDRLVPTVVLGVEAVALGAWMLRVHDVGEQRAALAVHAALTGRR